MSRRVAAIAIAGSTFGSVLLAPLGALQPRHPPRGARIAIAAYHDSRLFTLCPVLGANVIESSLFSSAMGARAAVFYPPTDMQTMAVTMRLDDGRLARAMLPVPAGRAQIVGPVGASAPAASPYLDRLARDLEVERRIAERFRERGTYAVVGPPEGADFVFVAESVHSARSLGISQAVPVTSMVPVRRSGPERIFSDSENEWRRRMAWGDWLGPTPAPPAGGVSGRTGSVVTGVIGGDRPANWRDSILGVVVPSAAFVEHAGDGAALSAASLWHGLSTEERNRSANALTLRAASPEDLADRFHERGAALPAFLPVCAATASVIRAIDDPDDTSSVRTAASPATATTPASQRTPAGERDAALPRFRSNVVRVTVPVTVTDRSGALVRELPLSSFRVFENGVEQEVERVDAGAIPADVILLLDTSAGMRGPRESIRSSAAALLAAMRADDRAMVVKFASRVQVLSELTSDRSALQTALAAAGPGGGTRLYDALALVAVDRLTSMDGRKAVVLVTDGIDTQSQLTSAAGALSAVDATGAPVHVIRYETGDAGTWPLAITSRVQRWLLAQPERPGAAEMARTEADRFLVDLSSGTGGQLYAARPDADIGEMIAAIAGALSNQLILAYSPIDDRLDGSYRRIRVEVDCEGCIVRARTGYRAGLPQ